MGNPFYRGFLGQEYYKDLGLINLNARLYNPFIGRFLSPDPIFDPSRNLLAFNPYAYGDNCPSMFSDPDGEFAFTFLCAITDFFGNLFKHGFNISTYKWKRTKNAWEIDKGMFRGNIGQIINKWTWGLPNSSLGYKVAQLLNLFGVVDKVTNSYGAVALSGVTGGAKAFTIGHYSFGPDNYVADWRDHLFVHEYGHYIQSQQWGPIYPIAIGIPSLVSAWLNSDSGNNNHLKQGFEKNASKLGSSFFDKHEGSHKEGYNEWSLEYFHLESFIIQDYTFYINPRLGSRKQDRGFPIE